MAPEIKGKPQVHTPQPTGVTTSALVQQPTTQPAAKPSAPPPDVPVPSANGNTGVVLGTNVDKKRDGELRKALDTLSAEIGGASDAVAIKKALDKAKNAANRDDVKAALGALSDELGQHADYGAIVFTHVKTDHFDHAKATLKAVAKEIGVKLGSSPGIQRAFADVRAFVDGRLAAYENDLAHFDPAIAIPQILAQPEAEAIESLLYFGADDRDEAEGWLAGLRSGVELSATLRTACVDRKGSVHGASLDLASDLRGMGPARGLATLLLRYPEIAPEVTQELGDDAPKVQAAIKQIEDDDTRLYVDWLRNGAVTVAGFCPWTIVGVGATLANGAVTTAEVFVAAREARVSAAIGLVPRERAEKLDDEFTYAIVMTGFSTIASAIPMGGKLFAEAVKSKGIWGAFQIAGKALFDHPALLSAVIGGFSAGLQAEVRDALREGDYVRAGGFVAVGVAEALAIQLGVKGLKVAGQKLAKLIERKPNQVPHDIKIVANPTPTPATPAVEPGPTKPQWQPKPISGQVQTKHGSGNPDLKFSKAPGNKSIELPAPKVAKKK